VGLRQTDFCGLRLDHRDGWFPFTAPELSGMNMALNRPCSGVRTIRVDCCRFVRVVRFWELPVVEQCRKVGATSRSSADASVVADQSTWLDRIGDVKPGDHFDEGRCERGGIHHPHRGNPVTRGIADGQSDR